MIGPSPENAPTIVMLHEGLGSAGPWAIFRQASGRNRRRCIRLFPRGLRRFDAGEMPCPLSTTCTLEALEVLPKLFDGTASPRAFGRAFDGASIAAIYAGSHQDHRVQGIALMAPHFIVEDVSVKSIAEIKKSYETTELRAESWRAGTRTSTTRFTDGTAPGSIRNSATGISPITSPISVPVAILQGATTSTERCGRVEIAQEECQCPVDVTVTSGSGTSLYREAPKRRSTAIADFARSRVAGR